MFSITTLSIMTKKVAAIKLSYVRLNIASWTGTRLSA
jgi:hypothetical protein